MNEIEFKEILESHFHVEFVVNRIDNGFDVYLKCFDNNDGFHILTEIKNETRLIVKAEPQKYGANFLKTINESSKEKRLNFSDLLNTNNIGVIDIKINDSLVGIDSFINDNDIWNQFEIDYLKYPFEIGDSKEIIRVNILMIGLLLSLINYSIEGFEEGNKKEIHSDRYERNPVNRQICLAYKGYKCVCCGFDFEKNYGEIGKDTIEVHHLKPVSELGEGYVVKPLEDLVPVCSNCHTIIHKRKIPYTVEEVKKMLIK